MPVDPSPHPPGCITGATSMLTESPGPHPAGQRTADPNGRPLPHLNTDCTERKTARRRLHDDPTTTQDAPHFGIIRGGGCWSMSLSPRTNPLPYLLSGLCCFRQSHFWLVVIDPQSAGLSGCIGLIEGDCGVEPPRFGTGGRITQVIRPTNHSPPHSLIYVVGTNEVAGAGRVLLAGVGLYLHFL